MNDQEILEKLQLATMPKEVQDLTLTQVHQVVELRLMGVVDGLLSDAQRATFTTLSKEEPKKVQKWLREQFPNLDELRNATLKDYLDEVATKTDAIL